MSEPELELNFNVDVDCIPACASFDGSAGRGFAFVPASDRPVKF